MDLEIEVKQAQNGNQEAFVSIIRRFELSLYRVARSILKNDVDCADAIQETILKAYQSIHTLKQPAYVKTWMIRILINQCNRILGRKKKIVSLDEVKEVVVQSKEYEQVELQEALDHLDNDLRIVTTLYYLEDLSVKEIAFLLKIPEGTIKSRLHRARITLADWFEPSKKGRFANE